MKRLPYLIGIAVVVAAAHTALFLSSWGEALELRFFDLWFNLRGPVAPPANIVVVAMDEDSYQAIGFPLNQAWPRAAHARLLQRLKAAGARRVVFDVLFLGESADPVADRQLAEAMAGLPVVVGAELGRVEEAGITREALLLPAELLRTNALAVGLVGLPEDGEFVRRFLNETSELALGLPTLAEAAIGGTPHPDPLPIGWGEGIRKQVSSPRLRGEGQGEGPGPRDFLNLYGPARTITTYSYYQVIDPEMPLPAEKLRDKIVFVGLCLRTELGPAQKDSYLTSFAQRGRTYGVELHATAAANLQAQNWIHRASRTREAVGLAMLALLAAFLLLTLRPLVGASIWVAFAGTWSVVAYLSFLTGQFRPGATLTFVVLPVTYLGSTLYFYIITRRQQRQLEKAFRLYLSPEMAREVARNPQALKLGGEQVEATAMFTDIEGFTSIAEKMQPDEVAQMLNAYFTEVMDAIFEQRGTLIKFIGDAVFGLWGAPIKTPDHAQLCCDAAMAIRTEIEKFNASGRFPPLKTRFGMHTGPMVVGNLGSARRFDFTAIGDSVNLASRVEGLNKQFGTTILVTDSTRARLAAGTLSLKLGLIRVAGKTQPVGLHTLFQNPVAVGPRWDEALASFCARDWNTAARAFDEVGSQEARLAKAAALYQNQIKALRDTPPASGWQGEIVLDKK